MWVPCVRWISPGIAVKGVQRVLGSFTSTAATFSGRLSAKLLPGGSTHFSAASRPTASGTPTPTAPQGTSAARHSRVTVCTCHVICERGELRLFLVKTDHLPQIVVRVVAEWPRFNQASFCTGIWYIAVSGNTQSCNRCHLFTYNMKWKETSSKYKHIRCEQCDTSVNF